jgi:hypothetical protein
MLVWKNEGVMDNVSLGMDVERSRKKTVVTACTSNWFDVTC